MGIDHLKLHSVQPGYLKNLHRSTHTHAAQKQGKETMSNLSPSTITAQWSSGATTQSATTPMTALDLSGATTQPADHNASSTQDPTALTKLRTRRNRLPRSSKETGEAIDQISRRYLNLQLLRNSSTRRSKAPQVSIESSKPGEPSATNLAPNNGENRRKSQKKDLGANSYLSSQRYAKHPLLTKTASQKESRSLSLNDVALSLDLKQISPANAHPDLNNSEPYRSTPNSLTEPVHTIPLTTRLSSLR
ncbi:hypothetical protein F511_31368 [Dorcoceras hygrometricum]|uniref:Uncharacterized protein n=1 Tax=Dorcoceras hygrometricum TaxID=472368 RepID=A0A2Z7A945_9LAMI|nr:hypothetical protein F511_31368 [Dorcoceras hygrometricum]